ncbi:hypothetical protein ABZU76_17940 [Amycolatopsis sp. NPDC005232]|uniref:hypothetical protein n=1 Tax=Amycolatopsis sp. NPDC005232 TaxID=3157027 RepID=UPI0033B5BD8F
METIGHVGKRRGGALARRASVHVDDHVASRFALGDMALELEPMRPQSGRNGGFCEALQVFAGDIGVEFRTPLDYDAVAAAWPEKHSSARASWTVYQRMAHLPGCSVVQDPPFTDRLGVRCGGGVATGGAEA